MRSKTVKELTKPAYYRWKDMVISEIQAFVRKYLETNKELELDVVHKYAFQRWQIGKIITNQAIENMNGIEIDSNNLIHYNKI